jgi:hypothetical protein
MIVSLPRVREHRLRASLTILGIELGVSVLVAVVLVSRSIIVGVSASVDDLAGKADLQVRAIGSGFDEAMLDRLAKVPGIARDLRGHVPRIDQAYAGALIVARVAGHECHPVVQSCRRNNQVGL